MKHDILIINGRVIDTASQIDEVRAVGIAGGKIVPVDEKKEAALLVDAADCYVMPGLIDFHTHLYAGGSEFSYNPDWLLSTGVTAAVDQGTCGYATYKAFHGSIVERSDVKIRSFLNVYPGGIYDYKVHAHYEPGLFRINRLKELKERYPDEILGLKVMMSAANVGEHGIGILELALKAAEEIGNMRVCVHTTDLPCDAAEVANILRPGDIYCHVYSRGGTIVDANGMVYDAIKRARERGVLFDIANGRMHFDFQVARSALADGFPPDIISTDAVSQSFNIGPYVKNLPFMMSKYLSLGLSLKDIVKAVTETPASCMGLEGVIGTLRPGAHADVAVCRMNRKPTTFRDINESGSSEGEYILTPVMTISDGRIAYCQTDFN